MDYNPAIHEAIITTQKGKMFMTQIRPVFAGQMLESNHPGSILWDTDWAHKRRWHYDSMGHKQGRMGAKPLATLARKASPHGFTRINTQRVVQRSMHPNMNGRL